MKPIRTIANNPRLLSMARLLPDIEFQKGLTLKLLMPCEADKVPEKRFPLVVFIQGSAWTTPDQFYEIPQLAQLARLGYVVATVSHRSCFEAPAPAFLEDVKSAIRFLRAHAADYHIDKGRVCAWGTSSGGNTALLLGLTGEERRFDVGENLEESSRVQAVVDCFGPTDLVKMATEQYKDAPKESMSFFTALAGCEGEEGLARLREISPVAYLRPEREYPPFLLLHGDADPVVLYEDTLAFFEKLSQCGGDAELVRVLGAPHEDSFWSAELLAIVFDFIKEKL